MPHTENAPKCFAQVGGHTILEWGIEAFRAAALDDVVFIGGYQIDIVRRAFPKFTFCDNDDWPNNNILASLMYAEEHMDDGFVCAYSDILFRPAIIAALAKSPHDITLVCDTAWRTRYEQRTDHPEDDGEKMAVHDGRLVAINRTMPSGDAHGEYIGVAHFSPRGDRLRRITGGTVELSD